MNVEVSTTKVVSDAKRVNRGEYRATEISFNFSDEFTDLTKVAVFSQDGTSYERTIEDNKVHIPYDVLKKVGVFTLGVYGYEGEGDNLVLRYSPSPQSINVIAGSYTQDITPEDDTSRDRYLTVNNLIAGDNIYLEKEGNNVTIIGTGGGGGGTTNYNYLTNKPQINGVELDGNKTSSDLGIIDENKIYNDMYDPNTMIGGAIDELNTTEVENALEAWNRNVFQPALDQKASTDTTDYLSSRISTQDNRIEQQNTNISNIDTELNTFKEDYSIDMGGIVEEINNRYTKTETNSVIDTKIATELANFDHLDYKIVDTLPATAESGVRYLIKHATDTRYEEWIYVDNQWYDIGSTEEVDLSGYYNKTETDNLLSNKASLSIDYGNDEVSVSQGTNSFTLSPATGGYELDISGSVVATLASKNYVDSQVSSIEEQIVGWTTITPNTYRVLDIRNAIASGKKRFTILVYMRNGVNRQATKYELTITELEKLFQKVQDKELVITRMIMGVSNTSQVAMLKQFVKQTYDENNQVIPGLLQIKYQGYENNSVIGTFDNFEYTVYGE